MIERKFVAQNFKEFQIKKYIKEQLSRVGLSSVKLQRTSLGEKLIIKASRPGLIVGRGGVTIQRLTTDLRKKFSLENPQIEIEEITDFNNDATVVAEFIVGQLERFGTQRFKGIGHKAMDGVMRAGALGVEILISGKIPSARAKTWRFADGYMKKCGDIALTGVDTSKEYANLKTGIVGVQVRIMPGTTKLPDQISFDKLDRVAAAAEKAQKAIEKKAAKEEKLKETKSQVEKKVEEKETKTKKSTKKTSTKKVTKKAATKKVTKETVIKEKKSTSPKEKKVEGEK